MPAQTHGRVRNGFDIFPKSKSVSKNNHKGKCANNKSCEKGFCCGKPLQPNKMQPSSSFRRLISSSRDHRKKATNVVIGRSAAAKRAIARRACNEQWIVEKD